MGNQVVDSWAASRAAHPAGAGGLPGPFELYGLNGEYMMVSIRHTLEDNFRLIFFTDSSTTTMDASRIPEICGVVQQLIGGELGYRQRNFVFEDSMLSVFALSRHRSGERQLAIMNGMTSLYLDVDGVNYFIERLQHFDVGMSNFLVRRDGKRNTSHLSLVGRTSEVVRND